MRFNYDGQSIRVIFGAGRRAEVGEELDRLGMKRALVLSTADQSHVCGEFGQMIGARVGALYPGAVMHTPVGVTESAMQQMRQMDCDGILAVGGGSTIGLGKAIAYRTDLPQLAVPTTYAGSEMTPILGQTEDGEKTTLRSAKVLPETVIYDPELTVTLPDFISGPSGMNAIAHAVEALYAEDANPIISLMAEESIRALGAALPGVMANGDDMAARGEALYGAWLAGACLGAVGMAIHHKICHTLGGAFAALAEIVAMLEADPETDWTSVNVSALRDHLVDMNALTLDAMVTEEPRDDGLSMIVTGKGKTLQAILHMVPAHAAELDKMPVWSASAATNADGAVLTVTSPDETVQTKIRGLGFFGLLATGSHHQAHHLAIARGMAMHDHH